MGCYTNNLFFTVYVRTVKVSLAGPYWCNAGHLGANVSSESPAWFECPDLRNTILEIRGVIEIKLRVNAEIKVLAVEMISTSFTSVQKSTA